MARKKRKGTELKVFSGREARLNRVIFMVLDSKKLLSKLWHVLGGLDGLRVLGMLNGKASIGA